MSPFSYRLARAVSEGREGRGKPRTREQVLARLLTKRAAAHRAGLKDLEEKLRHQIAWSLPMRWGEDWTGSQPQGTSALCHRQ